MRGRTYPHPNLDEFVKALSCPENIHCSIDFQISTGLGLPPSTEVFYSSSNLRQRGALETQTWSRAPLKSLFLETCDSTPKVLDYIKYKYKEFTLLNER